MKRTAHLVLLATLAAIAWGLLVMSVRSADYSQVSPELREWYRNARLTPEASARLNGWTSCCDHADVVRTKFRVGESGADVWEWLDPATDTWRVVPADIIHQETRSPDGRPTLFVYAGTPTCFFLPDGGI